MFILDYSGTKGDLIAELKMSHHIGGVGKLKNEQVTSSFYRKE